LLALTDDDGTKFFETEDALPERLGQAIFELETMELKDGPRIEVHRPGSEERRPFDHLSVGQQRSVLLSLLLAQQVTDRPVDATIIRCPIWTH
jgi:hypothetical protein